MRFSLRALLVLCSAGMACAAAAPSVCNGDAAFCSRLYSNVSVIGAHDSYAVGAGNLGANQNYTVTTQLDNGIRMLQVQGHMNNGSLHLCHTSCLLLDFGTFTSYLKLVKSWLDANPNEVITLLLVNSAGILPSVWAASYQAAGLMSSVYVPSSVPIAIDAWPTLGSMISAGTRVVNFLAQNADALAEPFLIDEFTNIWETPYDETDNSFPCNVDRVTGSPAGKMYLVNHFLDVNVTILGNVYPLPDRGAVAQTNGLTGVGSIAVQGAACQALHGGQKPTFTLVDYYDEGSVFQYAAQLNGVPYVARTIGNGSTSSTSGSNSTGSSGSGSTSGGGAVTSTPLSGGAALRSYSTVLCFTLVGLSFLAIW